MHRLGLLVGSVGSGVSHGRAATGSVVGAAIVSVVVTLTPVMADTNFTVSAEVQDTAADLTVRCITAKTSSSVTVTVENRDAINAASGTVHVLAVHD